jgi:hypothetical protein
MLTVKFSHAQYQNFIGKFLNEFFIQTNQQITLLERSSLITKMWSTDLTEIVPLIQSTYSKTKQGAPPKDVVALIRSLIIMAYHKVKRVLKYDNSKLPDNIESTLNNILS